jgi:F0F1-type ATP synthase assembly protein I
MLTRILEIAISLVVIAAVAFIGDRWRGVGGIIASMPLTIPLTMVIVFLNTNRDHVATSEFLRSAVGGVVATCVFTLVAWLTMRQRWPIFWVIASGYAAWGATVLAWQGVARLLFKGA